MSDDTPIGIVRVVPADAATTPPGVVRVWSAWVDGGAAASDLRLLDARERARAARFRSDRDRGRYVARHAFYRRVLARHLGVAPDAVTIETTSEGRPRLVTPDAPDFNTSHADGLAVIAVSRGRRVGVDIERRRHLDDAVALAEGHLVGRELGTFRALPPASRALAFLDVWTRKEAVVKAAGGGLSIPLASFDTGPIDGQAVRQVDGLPDGRSFALASLDWFPGWLGSLALEGAGIRLVPRTSGLVTA